MTWNRNKPSNRKWGFSRRKIPASRIPRSIARVRKQWVSIFNPLESCTTICSEFLGCGTTTYLHLLDNDELQSIFGDTCKVAALDARVWFKPVIPYPIDLTVAGANNSLAEFFNDRTIFLRAGLKKFQTSVADPDGITQGMKESFDWAEGQWMRTWRRIWNPSVNFGIETIPSGATYPFNMCSNTERALYIVPPTASGSQPTYNVPAITTTCTQIANTSALAYVQQTTRQIRQPAWKSISLSRTRLIALKENEELTFVFSWGQLDPDASCYPGEDDPCRFGPYPDPPCSMNVIVEARALIQYG